MPERRVCNFTHEEIEPGTGMMFVRRDGTVLWFKDSKSRKNMLKLKRNPRRLKWTRRYEKGGIN
ncbi:MAG TPA: 50S ribosomal protein L24e [Candidatus Poseidoniales archaeon]|jgi:large subunit ribosomal protein L24e|nr:50S ribosomal protein L24e [Candidatus Thalassarchaeum sp.]RZD51381.1 MAG: 50S ribosomal protein L24e [Euryarchaeota archaeon]HIE82199.1 50S ribosomal protein L24e [Candidatus Poseidoniales archaeon]|tara:strand:- start:150 stop:341 length:192 start_codon:yes stop_codon:yes gene_type:complete